MRGGLHDSILEWFLNKKRLLLGNYSHHLWQLIVPHITSNCDGGHENIRKINFTALFTLPSTYFMPMWYACTATWFMFSLFICFIAFILIILDSTRRQPKCISSGYWTTQEMWDLYMSEMDKGSRLAAGILNHLFTDSVQTLRWHTLECAGISTFNLGNGVQF